MPTLAAALDFAKLEARNLQTHQLGTAPSSPVKGQLYYNTADNTLYWYDGTVWVSGRGGIPADATGSTKGVIQLAGDLAGTAAAPVIAANAITSAKIADGTITDADVAAANKDGVVGLASLRTLGAGAQQAMPGNRTLDAITAPAADVSLNSKKIINLVDPVNAQDAASKNYVDNLVQGLDAKPSVRARDTGSNIALVAAPNTLDGVSLAQGDRVLVGSQATPAQNGIYVVTTLGTGANGSWTRATDMDAWTEVPGSYVWVEEGTTWADSGWVCVANAGGTLGTTSINFVLFSSAGTVIAGAGLFKTGNSIDVGAGTGIAIAADSVAVDSAIIPRYYSSATHSAGTSISIPQATHGCRASRGLVVMTVVEATGAEVLADVVIAANGDVTVTFAASQGANTIRTTVIG